MNTKITKKATPADHEPTEQPMEIKKPIGRPLKAVDMTDIRIKLLEAQQLCQTYMKTNERRNLLVKRIEGQLSGFIGDLKRKEL